MTPPDAADAVVALPWRVTQVERRAEKLDADKADKEDLQVVANEVKDLRTSVNRLMMAIVGSSVMVSFTLLITVGSHVAG